MSVRFSCQQCGQKLSVKEEKAGKPVRCPKCQERQTVPMPEGTTTAGVNAATGENPASSAATQQARSEQAKAAPVPPPPPPGASESATPSGVAPPMPGVDPAGPPTAPPASAAGDEERTEEAPPDFASLAAVEPSGEQGDMFAEFAVYDEPAEWVYEEEAEDQESTQAYSPKHYLAVPRKVLYIQGGLLAALAILGFLFGFVSGRLSVDPTQANNTARPANVSVVVLYHNEEGREVNDPHALVLIVPADQPFEEKLSRIGMSPGDPALPDNHNTFAQLQVLGGDMARTNDTGRCTLRVPRQGSYYVVCISQNSSATSDAKPADVAILGNFVMESYDLLDGTAYKIMQRNVTGNTTVNFRFE